MLDSLLRCCNGSNLIRKAYGHVTTLCVCAGVLVLLLESGSEGPTHVVKVARCTLPCTVQRTHCSQFLRSVCTSQAQRCAVLGAGVLSEHASTKRRQIRELSCTAICAAAQWREVNLSPESRFKLNSSEVSPFTQMHEKVVEKHGEAYSYNRIVSKKMGVLFEAKTVHTHENTLWSWLSFHSTYNYWLITSLISGVEECK